MRLRAVVACFALSWVWSGCFSVSSPNNPSALTGGASSNSAEATAADILAGKTAIVNGKEITGTLETRSASSSSSSITSGYYSASSLAEVDTDLVASNIRSGVTIFGVTGTANVYDTARTWDLAQSFTTAGGAGYYSAATNAPDASTVASGSTVLGVAGTASVPNFTGSNAFRADNATVNLLVQAQADARARATLLEETTRSANFTTNHLSVPNPKYDTDGRFTSTATTARRHYLVTVKGARPTKVCGLSGTIVARIADCALTANNGATATYEGTKYGLAGEADWKLVTAYKAAAVSGDACAGSCAEVWRDERTGLIWSDKLTNNYNWYQAAGYASSATTTANTGTDGGIPSATGKAYNEVCSTVGTMTCQKEAPVSVCYPRQLLNAGAGTNGLATYITDDGLGTTAAAAGTPDESSNKGLLGYTSTPQVIWRLPSRADFMQAEVDGIRLVLPNMDFAFWSTMSNSGNASAAWYFGGDYGNVGQQGRSTSSSVRCIGVVAP